MSVESVAGTPITNAEAVEWLGWFVGSVADEPSFNGPQSFASHARRELLRLADSDPNDVYTSGSSSRVNKHPG